MTTVCYSHKHKQVAIDSRITSNGVIRSDNHKKTLENDLGIWFFTGKVSDEKDICKLKHNDKVDVIPEASAYVISDNKVHLVLVNSDGYCEWALLDYDDAMGSGGDFALAALDFGEDAKGAIEYAKQRDIYTGGEVRVFNVERKGN